MSVDTTTLGANLNIRNTVTNRNTIAPVLFSICVNNNAPITLVLGDEHALNSSDVYQAVCQPAGQPVNCQNCTGTATLSVGEDTALNALNWLEHLNLLGGVGRKVLLQFYLSGGTSGDGCDVQLANTSGTSTNVIIQLNGSGDNDTQQMFWGLACGGTPVTVEVSCLSNTSGSEQVVFNVQQGEGRCGR